MLAPELVITRRLMRAGLKEIATNGNIFTYPLGYNVLVLAREAAFHWTKQEKIKFIFEAAHKFGYSM